MSISITIDPNNKQVLLSLRKLPRRYNAALRQAFYEIGKEHMLDAKKEILRKPKSGRTYIINRGSRRIRHIASAPGEAPANLTGNLRRSVGFKVHGSTRMEFGAEADYAGYLELGTRNMKARPYLLSTILKNEGDTQSIFKKHLNGALIRRS